MPSHRTSTEWGQGLNPGAMKGAPSHCQRKEEEEEGGGRGEAEEEKEMGRQKERKERGREVGRGGEGEGEKQEAINKGGENKKCSFQETKIFKEFL